MLVRELCQSGKGEEVRWRAVAEDTTGLGNAESLGMRAVVEHGPSSDRGSDGTGMSAPDKAARAGSPRVRQPRLSNAALAL